MGDRAIVRFRKTWPGGREYMPAAIYLHYHGSTVRKDMAKFFRDVEMQCGDDRRFDDPSYLAAKFIVWNAERFRFDGSGPLDFLSVGIVRSDVEPDERTFDVFCNDREKRPRVVAYKPPTKKRAAKERDDGTDDVRHHAGVSVAEGAEWQGMVG